MLSQEQAYDVAWAFAQKDAARRIYPLRASGVNASFGSDSTGRKILGCEHEYWSFIFRMEVPADVVISPEVAIVLVDPQTGKAGYFPVM